MKSRHPLWGPAIAVALVAVLLAGCTVPPSGAPAATPSEAPVEPTDTVVYAVPTAPSQASPAAPTEARPAAPAATTPPRQETPGIPEAGAPVGGRLTILHTNDARGYIDPCG